ncbi:MAG: trypsin-like peptidase domain-containing protein [Actinobacteria bacterium]|nr:trypsin-like peptidase domain-containing protein [Actinomycetota bacterium]MBO0835936.1 trypsin-like peptidase domain-containing protein [Actinomycetota bacterium]
MHEQSGEGEQPDAWAAWTTPARQPDQASPGGQQTAGPARQELPQPPVPPASVTQPIQASPTGYGQPAGGGYGGPPPAGYAYQPYGGYGPPGGDYGYGTPSGYGGPPRRRRGLATVITYLAVAALAATAGGLVVSFADQGHTGQQGSAASPGSGNNGPLGLGNNGNGSGAAISSATLQKVKNAVQPGLVIINSQLNFSNESAAGTGMIISKSGLVLTNNHVISQTTALTVKVVATNSTYSAKWLGYDQGSDVAVIQIQHAPPLTPVPLGDSSTVKVGDPVVGMGNAGGQNVISAVTGNITGIDKTIMASDQGASAPAETLTGMLQTDAPIISGDSGGPLASVAGKVIGMDTAASPDNLGGNFGFAIPINKAMTIAHRISSGKAGAGVQIGSTGFVGVLVAGCGSTQSQLASPQAQFQQEQGCPGAQQLPPASSCVNIPQTGLPATIAPAQSGTLILGVICRTPAATAGMTPGDVITKVAGQQVSSPKSLMDALKNFHGGSKVSITWVTTSGQAVTRTLTVGAAPPQ